MISTLIRSRFVNAESHLVSMKYLELFMTLVVHFVHKKRVVKIIEGEIIIDLWPKNI